MYRGRQKPRRRLPDEASREVGLRLPSAWGCFMRCVYLLRSRTDPTRRYIGSTDDLKKRLAAHNRGESPHTARYRPWEMVVAVAFGDHDKALAFERYLKTGSGRAFAARHFL